jgi:transposase
MFYRSYPGNKHDSKAFHAIIDEMFGIMEGLNKTKQRLTIVFDKGMNSDDNMNVIDAHQRVHFITTYSTYFAEEFARVPLTEFSILQTLANLSRKKDQVLVYRSQGEFWGKTRAVVVTFNPATRRKKQTCLSG